MKTESTNDRQSPDSGTMSNELIKALIDNYRQNQMNAINETMGIKDAHSIWFDLPKLKNFINQIEHEASKINPECTQEDLGIRFYYAAYPKIENWDIMESHPVPEEYSERHTLVMVPTLKKENENGEIIHFDFNALPSKKLASPALAARDPKPIKFNGENQGTLSPPASSMGML
ncbi:hypothetical protein PYS58_18870 [Chryseobacterium indologenes]|uniref:hypothetical protein n=1 Tax=Chryseobacterium indologenes TaxID=253 RepID=UPI0023E8B63A|nr:hypothetical protein [Chryseobacterium indologenes]MDM1557447.1 hypothetical protein [Chryseobacterium indologenes]WET48618.1 hypothetical protein PYS58_18870 [Chryseobacterium indologenes]